MSFDVIIVGGGLTGIAAAFLLDEGLKIAVVEKGDFAPKNFDKRNIAISASSVHLLKKAGLWQKLDADTSPIKHIIVNDDLSQPVLQFDASTNDEQENFIGKMVLAHDLINHFQEKLKTRKNVELFTNCHDFSMSFNPHDVAASFMSANQKHEIQGKILLGADGKNSQIRKLCNIETFGRPYEQTAIICSLSHSNEHHFIAHEIFLPRGPLAILPLASENESSIVLSEDSEIAQSFLGKDELSKDLLLDFLQKKCPFMRDLKIISDISAYELNLQYCKKYVHERVALIGDATHAIHPIAGQGFNLGLQDVKEITGLINENVQLGLDIGSQTLLENFEKSRKRHNMSMIYVTDIFNQFFSNNSYILKKMRRFGLELVSHAKPLQKFFMNYAGRIE